MNRRNFLAFIPALSAVPIIGKDIQKTESGLLIVQPEQVEQAMGINFQKWHKVECRLYQDGKHIADAFISETSLSTEVVRLEGDNGTMMSYPGSHYMTFKAEVMGPIQWDTFTEALRR